MGTIYYELVSYIHLKYDKISTTFSVPAYHIKGVQILYNFNLMESHRL